MLFQNNVCNFSTIFNHKKTTIKMATKKATKKHPQKKAVPKLNFKSVLYDELLMDNPKEATPCRVSIPKTANKMIEHYQAGYKERFHRKISKADVIIKLMALGSKQLITQADGMLK